MPSPNYVTVGVISALVCFAIDQFVKRKTGGSRKLPAPSWLRVAPSGAEFEVVPWLHAVIAGVGSVLCWVLEPAGHVEPYHSLHCRPRSMQLDSVIPMVSGGYALFDLYLGIKDADPAFALHGVGMGVVMALLGHLQLT
eukprot:SAG22_NODE_4923_length_1130_cov_1.962173_2_plen_138_part_01